FALLAPFTWAIVNVIDRFVMVRVARSSFVPAFAYSVVGIIGALVIYFVHGFTTLSILSVLLAMLAGMATVTASVLYFTAVSQEEISRIVPLLYFVPLYISVLAAIFLHEVFGPAKYIGILFLVLGATLLTYRPGTIRVSKPFWLMLVAAIFWAAAAILEKYLVTNSDVWTVYAWARLGAGLGAPLFIALVWREIAAIRQRWGSSRLAILGVNETINILAQLFLFFALSLGPVTLVSALGSVQSFFVLLLTLVVGFWRPGLLKEELGRRVFLQKFAATLLMFIGGFLVV
ncbi:hypothetical protein COV04_01985, partial [Candidatus Uhrbacteria bacterium CG10_big_fil_rev_8_21_14_0_10_48_11]